MSEKPLNTFSLFSGFSKNLLLALADGYFTFAIFAIVTNDGSDDGDDGSNDDDAPSPNRRSDDDGDGTGLRTASQ